MVQPWREARKQIMYNAVVLSVRAVHGTAYEVQKLLCWFIAPYTVSGLLWTTIKTTCVFLYLALAESLGRW